MFESLIYHIKSLFKQPFKVGIISTKNLANKTNHGSAVHAINLSRNLATLGCDIHIFYPGEKNKIKSEYTNNGRLVFHQISTKKSFRFNKPDTDKQMEYFLFDNLLVHELSKENKNVPFKIIHTHSWVTSGAFIAKMFNGIKWVHTIHSIEGERTKLLGKEQKKQIVLKKWVENTLKYADATIAVSDVVRKEAIKNYSLKPSKTFKIYNGVDVSYFSSDNTSVKEKTVIYVSRFSTEKGVDLIPKIADQVLSLDKSSKFIVVVPEKECPEELIHTKEEFFILEKAYPDRFIWKKEVITKEELLKLYKKSSILIQPSRYDSCPTTILEAMACGNAVIGSTAGGIPEIVGSKGLAIPLNVRLFSKKILWLLRDYKLRERYARRSLEQVKKFDWKTISKSTLDLYKVIAKECNTKEEDSVNIENAFQNIGEIKNEK